MTDKKYEEGFKDGERDAAIKTLFKFKDVTENRLRILERINWSMLGIVGFVVVLPKIKDVLDVLGTH